MDIASWLSFLWLRSPFVHCHQICCCCSFAKSCPTLCSPTNCSMPGFPVLHYFPEFAQTLIHWVSDVIQSSHPLSLPFPLTLNLSQHQGLFLPSGGQSIGTSASASVFPMNIQGWFPLGLTGLISLQFRGLSRVLKNISSSALSFLYSPTLTSIHDYWRNHGFD